MKKYKLILIIVISFLLVCLLLFGLYKIFFDEKDYVYKGIKYELSEEIAIRIGRLILIDRFPESGFNEETQFCADDNKNSWVIYNVTEDLYTEEGLYIFSMGGGYSVEIKKSNCEILKIEVWD